MGALDPDDGGQQLLLGKMLLERGLITPDQLREALVERARSVADGDRAATPLGGILVKKGYLTDSQLLGLMAEQSPNGDAAVATATQNAPAHSGPVLPSISAAEIFSTGTRLGKYQLISELGRGGMGVVYEAVDSQLNRKVALKLMLSNPNADPKERALEEERFIQEAQLSAKLKHPNIVTVYEAGLLEGRQFLSMEMIQGQAFGDWRKTVTVRDQIKTLGEVAEAVHHAHEQGILHRDLKPRNILVSDSGHPYVTDFGLAKSLGKNVHHSLTGSGAVVGTPAYMSPEQAQGLDRVDWRTDIYSLGVILYECMTGRTPFIGESPIEILMKVVKDPVVPPLQVVDAGAALGLDKTIENICLKALAKKDRDRYVTAQAFADDLKKWLAGEAVKVIVPRTPSAPGAHNRVYVLTGILFLVLCAGLVWLGMRSRTPSVAVELETAKKYMIDENYTEARIYYRVALAKDPNNLDAIAGEKAAVDGLDRKKREEEQKMLRGVEEKYKTAEQLRLEAAEKRRAELEAVDDEQRRLLAEQRKQKELEAKKAEEEAAKAEAQLRTTRGLLPPPPVGNEDVWKNAINLLPTIEPAKNSVWGTWELQDGRLISDRSAFSRVEIPFQLPQEYDVRMIFERRTGAGAVGVILSKNGQQFRWEMGGENNTRFCFEVMRQFKTLDTPAVLRDALALRNDKLYLLVLKVRADGVQAELDTKPLLAWKTDFTEIGLNPAWKLRNTLRLGLTSQESETVVHRLELREVLGKGRRPQTAAPITLKALPSVPGALKPGLIGEYYQGPNFQSLASRRIVPSIDFHWNEGAAWDGGPVDSFSCRWAGYLHVPRTNRYFFTATADDGMRVVIDDQQIVAGWSGKTDATRGGECTLDEGYHRIVVEHYETAYMATAVLSWSGGPGQLATPIPSKSFFHSPADFKLFVATKVPEFAGVLSGHANNVTSLAFEPEGKVLASASEDRKVKLWDVASLRDLGSPAAHPAGVLSVGFAPGGKRFATGARDAKVRVWDFQNRTELKTLEGPVAYVQALAFSPDGERVAAGSFDKSVRIWSLSTEDDPMLLKGHTAGVESVAFSPDGKYLASSGMDSTIRLWSAKDGKDVRVLEGHADFVECVAFSPGGKALASCGWDGLVKIWDVESGRELRVLAGHGEEISAVAFSPDGKVLATGGHDGMVRIWDPVEGQLLRVLPGHTARVMCLAFAPGSRLLASGSFDGSVRLWNLAP